MTERRDDELSPEAKRAVEGPRKLPKKICPYCGTRNEAPDDNCVDCGKDISWIRIPEPSARIDKPKEKPRSMPKQREPFKRRNIVIFVLALLILLSAALILVLSLGGGDSAETSLYAHQPCRVEPRLFQRLEAGNLRCGTANGVGSGVRPDSLLRVDTRT